MNNKTDIYHIVKTPWGVCEDRKNEIINGSYGALTRILKTVREKEFYTIEEVATVLDCSVVTAWKKVKKENLRHIVQKRKYLFYFKDIKKLN